MTGMDLGVEREDFSFEFCHMLGVKILLLFNLFKNRQYTKS